MDEHHARGRGQEYPQIAAFLTRSDIGLRRSDHGLRPLRANVQCLSRFLCEARAGVRVLGPEFRVFESGSRSGGENIWNGQSTDRCNVKSESSRPPHRCSRDPCGFTPVGVNCWSIPTHLRAPFQVHVLSRLVHPTAGGIREQAGLRVPNSPSRQTSATSVLSLSWCGVRGCWGDRPPVHGHTATPTLPVVASSAPG
jgi:hypothetical protein